MRKWKEVGSVGSASSINSPQKEEVKSNRSQSKSPFRSFHQYLQNKSQHLIDSHEKSFCYNYMQRQRESSQNITYDLTRSEKRNKTERRGGDDMFTSMRNVLKEDQVSKLSSKSLKSLEDPTSRLNSGSTGQKKMDSLKKTGSKVRHLKKEQSKLRKHLQNQVAAIKNIFHQLDEVLFDVNKTTKETSQSNDPELLQEIVKQAIGVQRYFAQMDRKKQEIMSRLQAQ